MTNLKEYIHSTKRNL